MEQNNSATASPSVDFLDAQQGLAYWDNCALQTGSVYAAYIKIRVFVKHQDLIAVVRLREFIKSLFGVSEVFEEPENACAMGNASDITFTLVRKDISLEADAERWLTCCTILNTYREYFTATTGIYKIKILYGINAYPDTAQLEQSVLQDILPAGNYNYTENLAINDLVFSHTCAKTELGANPMRISHGFTPHSPQDIWYAYNLLYSKLAERLATDPHNL